MVFAASGRYFSVGCVAYLATKAPNLAVSYSTILTLRKLISISLLLMIFCSCKEQKVNSTHSQETVVVQKVNKDSLLAKRNNNIRIFGGSLLTGKTLLLKQLIDHYQVDTCGIIAYEDSVLEDEFEHTKAVGDINGNKVADTVFVLPPFNYCDDGDSYYFFDTTLPRLHTDSYCCHPDNLFPIGDINEDGAVEICIFYSSCVSRFKSLVAFSLKNKTWKEIGSCTFDVSFMKPDKQERVRKLGKGKFEMLEIIDKAENKAWKHFSF